MSARAADAAPLPAQLAQEVLDHVRVQFDNQRSMTASRVRARGRICAAMLGTLVLIATGAEAQRTPQEMDRAITELQASIDQLKKDGSLASDVDRVNRQLDTLQASVADRLRSSAAPPVAWGAFGVVGALFVVVWGIVSWRREGVRDKELLLDASLKAIAVADRARIERDVNQRIQTLVEALKKMESDAGTKMESDAGTPLDRQRLAEFLAALARSLTQPTDQGNSKP